MRGRRIKPSTVEGRRRKAELGKIIANARTPKAEREAALRELEALAPLASGQDLQDWNQRIETAKNGSSSPVKAEGGSILSRGTPDSNRIALEQALTLLAVEDRARFIRKAENATAQEKAEVILAELPDHPLNKLARELAHYLWEQDLSNPKPSAEALTRGKVRGWLARQPFNRHDVRGNVQTVSDAVNDVYRLLAERDSADPGWFVRRAEKLLDAPALLPVKTERGPEPEPPQASSAIPIKGEEAPPSPIERVGSDRAQLVEMILRTDSFLRSLSAVNFELNEKIRAALTAELLRVGHIAGTWAAALYNSLRREYKLFSLPERRF